MTEDWFDEPEEQSRVKADIVVSYFAAWAKIMSGQRNRIAYIDLYAGPGRYNNGDKTTPLLVLEKALASPQVAARLVTVFNDENPSYAQRLEEQIAALPRVGQLRFKPHVGTRSVDESLADQFERIRSVPALTFLDPWGYRGLTRRLIASVTKDFGCETIFFFNYDRINAAVENEAVAHRLQAIFSPDGFQRLRDDVRKADPGLRETLVLRALGDAVRDDNDDDRYMIPFRFRREHGRVSHYICFVTKHPLGLGIMKDIMARRGSVDADGVPKFEYVPTVRGRQLVFETERPLLELPASLLGAFGGRTITVRELYRQHHPGTPFILKNYQRVLLEMEGEGRIMCKSTRARRPAGTMAKHLLVTFPRA